MFNKISIDIVTKQDLLDMISLFKQNKPNNIAMDTETTGLNIRLDTPFLFQFGYLNNGTVYTYAVDLELHNALALQTIAAVYKLAKHVDYFMGHNVKFDLHMLTNIGFEYPWKNLTDTQIYIRLAHDALIPKNGGPSLKLKEYCVKYIDRRAKDHDHLVQAERSSIAQDYNRRLLALLKPLPNPPAGYKSWTKGALEDLFNDVLATADYLPTAEMRQIYYEWYATVPECIRNNMTSPFVEKDDVPYTIVNRETLTKYGHYDIYYTLCVWAKTKPVLEVRGNQIALDIENRTIYALFEMERTGFQINKDYVYESKKRMEVYIRERRQCLKDIVGYYLRVNQHDKIKEFFKEKWDIILTSTKDEDLEIQKDTLENKDASALIGLIQELRTLEKWYKTYLLRFINELRTSDRIYTQINQVGAVSGRVTSDFQQFPKFGIRTFDDKSLFNPREMVVVSGGIYKSLMYLDYSQIELRLQAMYTILVGHPDLNLCRAYMPYKCFTQSNMTTISNHQYGIELPISDDPNAFIGTEFDYNNPEHIKHAYNWDWYRIEDKEPWTPTDVHAATTAVAFPELDPHSDLFKKYRGKVGKRVNFAKNYGARYSKIATMFPQLHFTEEQLHSIDDAYYKAFPGVKQYHDYCYKIAQQQAYSTNLFGVRYYGLSGHKTINCLVQGSGAYFLKLKMIAVTEFLKDKKTKFQMNIHDEMSFEVAEGEEPLIFEIQKIMQTYDDALVPLVAELEVTTKSWADKVECETLDDVYKEISK